MLRNTLAVGLVAIAMALGCSRTDPNRPKTVKAGGKVTLNGQPVEGANVTLAAEGQGRAGFGKTDAQGRFQLATTSAIDGVLPGTYQVSIMKQRTEGGMTSEESQAFYEKTGKPPPPPKVIDELPPKYANPAASELKAIVNASGPNDFTFELKK